MKCVKDDVVDNDDDYAEDNDSHDDDYNAGDNEDIDYSEEDDHIMIFKSCESKEVLPNFLLSSIHQ